MTDWIEHTTNTCPVDPETVVEVLLQYGASIKAPSPPKPARRFLWTEDGTITHYRIITPAPTPPLFLGGDPAKPPEPEMTKTAQEPEPDLITLRLECLKIAVPIAQKLGVTETVVADALFHYVLNGSVDKA
jgi:hypothetical protein